LLTDSQHLDAVWGCFLEAECALSVSCFENWWPPFFYWSEKLIVTWHEFQTLQYIRERVKFMKVFEQFQPEIKSQHFACQ
jgi:hypothetical protein